MLTTTRQEGFMEERTMFIKELDLQGFKSFANRTKIPFQHPVTAVVGPNGCGKSNILDAIKWVMGEKSVKSIRGERMEDLIFSGTETQKAANFAQVTLNMNNKEKFLPIDTEEVRISRRMYRDGKSQYFLNDTHVARHQIENLLLDTGLGKSSYSFMAQGQIDMILSSKPAERRQIFEEAAGISRFKSQQDEARKNLENTNVNLTRVSDIQRELERELKVKKEQAEKTKQYNELREKHKEHDLKIRYMTIYELDKSLVVLQEKLQKKIGEKEKAVQKTLQYQEQLTLLESEKEQRQNELHEKDVTNQISLEKISRWENDIKDFNQKKINLQEEANNLRSRTTKLDQRVKALKKQLHSQSQLTLDLDMQISDATKSKEQLEQEINKLEQEVKKTQEDLVKVNERQKENRENLKKLRLDLETVIKELLASLKREKDTWQKEDEQRKKNQQAVSEGLRNLEAQLTALKDEMRQATDVNIFADKIENYLKENSIQEWLTVIEQTGNLSEGLTHLLFDRDGVHARKETLDELIGNIEKENENLESSKIRLQKRIEELKENRTIKITQKESLLGEIKSFHATKEGAKEREKNLTDQLKNEEANLQYMRSSFNNAEAQLIQLAEDEKKKSEDINKLQAGIAKEINAIKNLEKKLETIESKKENLNKQIEKENEKNKQIFEETNMLEVKIGTHLGLKESHIQDIYNDYNMTIQEIEEQIGKARINLGAEKDKLNELQKAINALGTINPLAIEELESVEKYYNHNQEQIDDIKEARSHIEKVIEEIQQKSEQMFLETFKLIQENFLIVFQKLFNGGHVQISLTDESAPLQSGIDIQAQPPGKKPQFLSLLSGGERTLTAISLMFAIYMVRSSPFCVLDEIDANLDDQNVIRIANLIQEFGSKTQFILITHNKRTMAVANAMFGVSMDKDNLGVSRLLAVEMK